MTTARLSAAGDPLSFWDMLRYTFAWIIFIGLGGMWLAQLWARILPS